MAEPGDQSQPSDIVMMDALALSRAINASEASCVEVMNAYLDHIAALRSCAGQRHRVVAGSRDLLQQAQERDEQLARGELSRLDARLSARDQGPRPPTKGIRTTHGLAASSRISSRPPTRSSSSA